MADSADTIHDNDRQATGDVAAMWQAALADYQQKRFTVEHVNDSDAALDAVWAAFKKLAFQTTAPDAEALKYKLQLVQECYAEEYFLNDLTAAMLRDVKYLASRA